MNKNKQTKTKKMCHEYTFVYTVTVISIWNVIDGLTAGKRTAASTTHNHGFFLSAVLLKCMGRLAYSSNNVEVLLPLSLLGHSKNMYVKKSGLGR